MTPEGVTRPILLSNGKGSVNHRFPSGPAVIRLGLPVTPPHVATRSEVSRSGLASRAGRGSDRNDLAQTRLLPCSCESGIDGGFGGLPRRSTDGVFLYSLPRV